MQSGFCGPARLLWDARTATRTGELRTVHIGSVLDSLRGEGSRGTRGRVSIDSRVALLTDPCPGQRQHYSVRTKNTDTGCFVRCDDILYLYAHTHTQTESMFRFEFRTITAREYFIRNVFKPISKEVPGTWYVLIPRYEIQQYYYKQYQVQHLLILILILRGAIVCRTYGPHKNLYI